MPVELADSYESIYRQAIAQMSAGNADEAIDSMLRIVNRLSRFRPETLERKSDLQQMLASASGSAIEFLRWQKRYDEAIAVCQQVADLLPSPEDVRRRSASLMIEKGEIEDGLARLRQMAEETPVFAAWVSLGAEHLALEQYSEAEACYQSALSLADSNEEAAAANRALFEIYKETGRKEEALSAWNMAVVLDASLADDRYQVARWLIAEGDLQEAKKYIDRDRDPVRRAFYGGLLDSTAGREQAARKKWPDVLEIEVGEERSAVEAWMEAALRLGQPGDAIVLAEKLPVGLRSAPDIAVWVGAAHAMQGEVDQAGEWFEQVLSYFRRAWPSRAKIPAEQWTIVRSLISDDQVLQHIETFFDLSEGGM